MSVTLTVSHGATSFTTQPVTITTTGFEAPWTISYPAYVGNQGDTISLAPVSTFQDVQGATSTFTWAGIGNPTTLTLDPATGAIGGWIGVAGALYAAVTQTVTFPDGSVQSVTSSGGRLDITGPSFNYVVFSHMTRNGQPFSISPTPISGGMPGDVYSFSMIPTPGGGGDPLPAWLNIDAATGVIYGVAGTPPPSGVADVTIVLTTLRAGHTLTATTRIDMHMQ